MVRLSAIRLCVNDRFSFCIEADASAPSTTCDPIKAATLLAKQGVKKPMDLVDHVREWGTVEVDVTRARR